MQVRPLSAVVDKRRTDITAATQIAAGIYRFSAYVQVDNPGEAIAPISFPVIFTEKPVFFWGAEVAEGIVVAAGGAPIAVPIVSHWQYRHNTDTGTRWYTGATIIVVSSGIDIQSLIIGCHFEGRAPRQPVNYGS